MNERTNGRAPRSRGAVGEGPAGQRYPEGEYTGLGVFDSPRRRGRPILLLAGAAVLVAGVVLGLVVLGGQDRSTVAGEPRGAAENLTAYPEGTCLYETPGDTRENVTLRRTPCAGSKAVFVVNHTVRDELACARFGDYGSYGLVQADNSAGAVYCLSLVVPRNGCVHLAGGSAPQRTDCGAVRDARRVAGIVRSAEPRTACARLPGADPWYHRSPERRLVACLLPV